MYENFGVAKTRRTLWSDLRKIAKFFPSVIGGFFLATGLYSMILLVALLGN